MVASSSLHPPPLFDLRLRLRLRDLRLVLRFFLLLFLRFDLRFLLPPINAVHPFASDPHPLRRA